MGDRARAQLAGSRFGDVRWVPETGSTNRDLLALAAGGAAEGVVLVADHQSSGRGRLGRTWQAPPGASLLVSILFRPRALAVSEAHHLTAAVGVAASDACRAVAGVDVRLKWPNDLIAGGRKLGGILAESTVTAGRLEAVVAGLGLNVNWPSPLPADLAPIAIALNHLAGRDLDREELLVAILRNLGRWYPQGAGLVDRYRGLLDTLGRPVRVELPDRTFDGEAVDVTPEGHLVVDAPGGRQVVTAGDVVHLRAT